MSAVPVYTFFKHGPDLHSLHISDVFHNKFYPEAQGMVLARQPADKGDYLCVFFLSRCFVFIRGSMSHSSILRRVALGQDADLAIIAMSCR